MNKKNLKNTYSEIDQIVDNQSFIESMNEGFNAVEDPRVADNRSYPLVSLLVMILCAVIAGANAITQIQEYVEIEIDIFKRILGIKRAPSYSVFWWLLTRLNPKPFQDAFTNWIQSLSTDIKERIIAIDGKRLRGASHKQPIHLIAARDDDYAIRILSKLFEEKM